MQFKSQDIGVETAKPQDIFAKQREEAEKQKQTQKQTRKLLIIIFSILGALIIIGLLIWFIVWLVQSNQPTGETPTASPTVIVSGSDEEIGTNQILLSELQFYFANNRYEEIRNMFDSIDPNALTPNQQATYYNAGYLAFYDTEPERAQEYIDLAYDASQAAGNGLGGGDE